MLEKVIEKKVREYAKKNGYLSYKLNSDTMRGLPDRLFITPYGKHLYIEFKQLGKLPTGLQQFFIDVLKDQKCDVFVVDSVEKGIEILNKFIGKK